MTRERERPEPQPEPVLLQHVARLAKETLLRDGYHVPTLVVDGTRLVLIVQILELAPHYAGRAEQMFIAGGALAREGYAGPLRRVYFVCEAWMSEAREGMLPERLPSEDPLRKEVLVISGMEVTTGQAKMAMYEMVRDSQGELRELRDVDQPAGAQPDSPLLEAFVAGYVSDARLH